jgi:hypothetical protein
VSPVAQTPANDTTLPDRAAAPLRIRIPRLLDVLLVSDPAQIRWLNHQPQVVRALDPSASLLHRVLERRMNVDLAFDGAVLPVFQLRHESARAIRQHQLEQRLRAGNDLPGQERSELSAYVAGDKDSDSIGVTVQQWCGRLFHPHYRASPETYDAGSLLATWPSAPPWKTIKARASGQLERAKRVLASRAEGDVHCVHATSIGMNNVTRTIERMRAAAADPDQKKLSADEIVLETLVAPPAVLRGCSGRFKPPFLARPLTERTLIVFLVARAFARSRDLDVAFLTDHWSGCPAHDAVPELLRAVWHSAQHGEIEHDRLFAKINVWTRLWHRAVS